jgi:Predicted ATPase
MTLNNLPIQLTSFIGRERELAEVKHLISTSRLVTLTGAGGCGKTLLALRIATDLSSHFEDGVWWIELAVLHDPELSAQAVLQSLGLPESPTRTPLDLLTDYFQAKHSLLILDNCEHIIDACANFVSHLLPTCPQISAVGYVGIDVHRAARIAERLVVSRCTVEAHLRSIYEKLGVKSRDAAIL